MGCINNDFTVFFIGFIIIVLFYPTQRGDKAMVLCFVEFTDTKCALTAMEALQGWILHLLVAY